MCSHDEIKSTGGAHDGCQCEWYPCELRPQALIADPVLCPLLSFSPPDRLREDLLPVDVRKEEPRTR